MMWNKVLSFSMIASLTLPAMAQEPAEPSPKGEPHKQGKQEPQASEERIQGWIEQLGDPSYRERRAAEDELRRVGKPALEALQKAADGHGDPEVRWRAGRLVQQIEGGGLRRREGDRGDRRPEDAPDLDALHRRLNRRLDRQMEEIRRLFRGAPGFGPFRGFSDLQGLQGPSDSRGFSMEVGPDGVRVEIVEKNEEGEEETKVYEAPDLETFKEKYPGVLEEHGLGSGFRFDFGPGMPFMEDGDRVRTPRVPRFETLQPRRQRVEAPPKGRRLGVYVGELHPAVARYLGGGILVQEVEEGSLAARLGIEAGDVVLKIGGRKIEGRLDVADALGAIEEGDTVEVVVNRGGHMKTLKAEKKVGGDSDGRLEKRGK